MKNQLLTIFILGLAIQGNPVAGTYKWVDQDGNVVYSQNPPPEGQYETIRVKPGSRKSVSEDGAVDTNKRFLQDADKKRGDDKKIQAATEKSAKIRADNCQNAKNQLEFYTVHRRIKGKDGEYTRMDDKDREQKLQEARQAIKDFCD